MGTFSIQGPRSGPVRIRSAAAAIAIGSLPWCSPGAVAHERPGLAVPGDVAPETAAPHPAPLGAPSAALPTASGRAAPRPLNPATGGAWSAISDWPLVAVHAALLPDGRVIAWDATPDDSDDDPHTADSVTTRVTLWNPADDSHVDNYNDTGTDLFCAGSAHLWDGQLLFAGGDAGRGGTYAPISHANLFDPENDAWERAGDLNAPRWYSSVATLGSGEMLTWGGGYQPKPAGEVFRFDRTWRPLTSAVIARKAPNADYQWIQQIGDGSVLWFGPENRLASIDTDGEGSWTVRGPRDDIDLRDYGSYAYFDVGRILVAGGGASSSSAIVIDTDTRQASDTSPLSIGRKQHMLTVLADGSVLATGGNRDAERFYSTDGGVLEPEIWDPASERWTVMNPMAVDRQYHSVALLLADGRVLSAGGGLCAVCYEEGYEEANAEIFSPPYLFGDDGLPAPRPRLSGVPAAIDYGAAASVTVAGATPIERAHLIKLGSATHSQNQDQRLVPLTIEQDGATLRLGMPSSRTVAPPGHYLLFAVDRQGVPSEGAVVKLGQPLVAPGQQVHGRLSARGGDSYAVPASDGALSVSLTAGDDVRLVVSADASSGGAGEVRCRIDARDRPARRCVVDGEGVERWLVTLAGTAGDDYVLTIDTTTDAPTDVPTGGEPVTGSPGTVPDPTPDPVDGESSGGSDSKDGPDAGTDEGVEAAPRKSGGGALSPGLLVMLAFSFHRLRRAGRRRGVEACRVCRYLDRVFS